MSKSQWRLSALAVVAIVASACSGSTTSSAPSAAASAAAPSTAASAEASAAAPSASSAFDAQWADLIAKAKTEGEVVVVTGPEGVQDDGDWLQAFGDQYGIKTTIVGGATADTTARISAERAQGVYSVDVSTQGGTGTQNFLDAGFFDKLDPLLINPEVTDRSTGFAVDHPVYTADDAIGICQYVGVQAEPNLISFWYNTDVIPQDVVDSVKSFDDLLDPAKFKDKIVIGDVASNEADRDATSMWQVKGQEWWDKLLDPALGTSVVAYGDERTFADGLAQGKWGIGMFPPGSGSLEDAEKAGLPVKIWQNTLSEGSPRSGIQRDCVMKNAPHPAAAQLLANWMLMKDGQTALNAKTNRVDRASIRDDVPQGKITDDIWTRARDKSSPFIDDVGTDWLNQKKAFNDYITAKYKELNIVPGG